MIRILFVCHGNICRSPMAEYIFRQMAEEKGCGDRFLVRSAATSCEELGNPVFPPAKRLLAAKGIRCDEKRAVRMQRSDYDSYDLLICMDGRNLRGVENIAGPDTEKKVHLLLEYTGKKRDVADPYYSGDFDACLKDIEDGCRGLLKTLTERKEKFSMPSVL